MLQKAFSEGNQTRFCIGSALQENACILQGFKFTFKLFFPQLLLRANGFFQGEKSDSILFCETIVWNKKRNWKSGVFWLDSSSMAAFQCAFDRNGSVLVAFSNQQDSDALHSSGKRGENVPKASSVDESSVRPHTTRVHTGSRNACALSKSFGRKSWNSPFIDSEALILPFMSVKRSEEGKEMVKFFLFPARARRFSLIRLTHWRRKEERKRA